MSNICFDCEKFAVGCSWSERFVPVDGWEAEPVQKKIGRGKSKAVIVESYDVKKCPLFEKTPERKSHFDADFAKKCGLPSRKHRKRIVK